MMYPRLRVRYIALVDKEASSSSSSTTRRSICEDEVSSPIDIDDSGFDQITNPIRSDIMMSDPIRPDLISMLSDPIGRTSDQI